MRSTSASLIILLNILLFTPLYAQEMPLVYNIEHTGADWPAPYMLSKDDLPTIEALPDPFGWSDGRGRIIGFADWKYRRAEIKAEIEHYEIGEKPVRPDSINASYEDGTLTVNITVNGNTLTLTSDVTLPDGEGPFPAMINCTATLPSDTLLNRGIAIIPYNFWQVMADGQTRGSEPINALYPDLVYMGSYSAWSWGVSRLIDGLELVSGDLPIDTRHLGITGCSRWGKMALFAGAFDERIALTLAVESGGGGYPAWRVSETLGNVETLGATSRAWFIEYMFQFANAVSKLPHDHHELLAMVAPRALLVTGNPDYEWLADESGHVSSNAAKEVYNALGIPDRFGYSIIGGHAHCQVPSSQIPEMMAFVRKFLLGDNSADTDVSTTPYNTNLTPWIDWTTPVLSSDSSYYGHTSLIHPAKFQTQLDTAVDFSWNQVDDAATYHFQVSTTPTFETTISSEALSDTTRTVTGLSFATPYYWRVQVENGEGSLGPWIAASFATFISLPDKPELVSATPAPRRANNIRLKWRSVPTADEYSVQLSDEPDFSRVLLSDMSPDTMASLNGTVEAQRYLWRVAGKNLGGLGPWSDAWDFTIIVAPTTLKLQRSAPREITLTWRDYSEVEDGYVIERLQSPDTSFTVIDTMMGSGEAYVDSTVVPGERYTYRIKAFKDSMESLYSNEASLTLTTGIEDKAEIPNAYSISQNYPNPFNPTTKIKFALPKSGFTKIVLYDLLGRAIRTLINEEVKAGYHEIHFDGDELPGGVYLYRIQSGDFIQSRKMILMK